MIKRVLLVSVFFVSQASLGWISEEIDDHHYTSCESRSAKIIIDGMHATVKGKDTSGRALDLSGELLSLTIDTADKSLNYRIALDANAHNLSFFTVKSISDVATTALHRDISTVVGSLGEVLCIVDWKSNL